MHSQVPPRIKTLLVKLAKDYRKILQDSFVGFYVHGSLALGCFNVRESDIDFLVVVSRPLSTKTKRAIIDTLLEYSQQAPPKGFEMSIVRMKYLHPFVYPTPFELHFGNAYLEKYKTDKHFFVDTSQDPDLAAHATITKARGLCLLGKPIDEVFGDIPREYYLDSIRKDSQEYLKKILRGRETKTCPVPSYGVLNACRVLAFIGENIITSKLEGGQWAIKNLPKKYSTVIRQAIKQYTGRGNVHEVDVHLLKQFAKYAREKMKVNFQKNTIT